MPYPTKSDLPIYLIDYLNTNQIVYRKISPNFKLFEFKITYELNHEIKKVELNKTSLVHSNEAKHVIDNSFDYISYKVFEKAYNECNIFMSNFDREHLF